MTFDKNGSSEITVTGVKGAGCQALTQPLVAALGAKTKSEDTRERFETEPVRATIQSSL